MTYIQLIRRTVAGSDDLRRLVSLEAGLYRLVERDDDDTHPFRVSLDGGEIVRLEASTVFAVVNTANGRGFVFGD